MEQNWVSYMFQVVNEISITKILQINFPSNLSFVFPRTRPWKGKELVNSCNVNRIFISYTQLVPVTEV